MTDRSLAVVWIALGSNLGDRTQALESAVTELKAAGLPAVRFSHLYETVPEHGRNEPPYLNAVVQSVSREDPSRILATLGQIEEKMGRNPEDRAGSRTLDLDLLAVGDLVVTEPQLILPHPRLAGRDFVLVPLCEIEPRWILPGTTRSAAELLHALPYHAGAVQVHAPLRIEHERDETVTGSGFDRVGPEED